MAKKVYTIEVNDENLKNTTKSKSVTAKKNAIEEAVESFGILEINNASAKNKVKNTKDTGFEKNVTGCAKKSVKSQLAQVDDYFDFSFRPNASACKTEVVEPKAKKVAKAKKAEPAKTVKKSTTKKATTNKSAKVLKMDAEVSEVERSVMVAAEVCDRISIDGDAEKIMSVARLGALFG